MTFIDVGQGDAGLVRFPHGGTLLVDAGGVSFDSSFDIGERIVAPVVRDAGFYRLDRLALTHGDPCAPTARKCTPCRGHGELTAAFLDRCTMPRGTTIGTAARQARGRARCRCPSATPGWSTTR